MYIVFLLIYALISYAGITLTALTFLADTHNVWVSIFVYVALIYAWFSPILIWSLQPKTSLSLKLYTIFARSGYFMYGFVFLLTVLIVGYDILWSIVYIFGNDQMRRIFNPENLEYAKYLILSIVLLLSLYAVYSAEKLPKILRFKYSDTRILKPFTMMVISDLHITKMTSMAKIEKWVHLFNQFKPDVMVLPGDIADDTVENIKKHIRCLKKLHAPMGIFYAVGNHETYFDLFMWEAEFASFGWRVLHNSGAEVENTGVYIGGVPNIGQSELQIKQAFRQSSVQNYKILLSHDPVTATYLKKSEVDLQISGHTHGGQIFPFHILTKLGNRGMLAGEYSVNSTKVLISRGVGYWGPPMRLFAPSDVLLINFEPA